MKHETISKGIEKIILDAYMTSPNLSEFQKTIEKLLSENINALILDFNEVIMIDSATIGYLFRIYKLSLQKNFKLKLISLNDKIYEILEIMGLERLFDFHKDLDEAIESLSYA